jgi:hypothetical protein
MKDVTESFARYVECASHIWNTYFYPKADWDELEYYQNACKSLFYGIVLYHLERDDLGIVPEYHVEWDVYEFLHVIPQGNPEIWINREINSGYWDWNGKDLRVGEGDVQLRFIDYFDWDWLGCRYYEYMRCMIVDSIKYSGAKGKQALIKSEDVKVLFDDEPGTSL